MISFRIAGVKEIGACLERKRARDHFVRVEAFPAAMWQHMQSSCGIPRHESAKYNATLLERMRRARRSNALAPCARIRLGARFLSLYSHSLPGQLQVVRRPRFAVVPADLVPQIRHHLLSFTLRRIERGNEMIRHRSE